MDGKIHSLVKLCFRQFPQSGDCFLKIILFLEVDKFQSLYVSSAWHFIRRDFAQSLQRQLPLVFWLVFDIDSHAARGTRDHSKSRLIGGRVEVFFFRFHNFHHLIPSDATHFVLIRRLRP